VKKRRKAPKVRTDSEQSRRRVETGLKTRLRLRAGQG